MGSAALPDLSLLRAHKALPKRRAVSSDAGTILAAARGSHIRDLEREGYSSSERIRSWIPEPSSIQPVTDPALPLTPPLNAVEKVNGIIHCESWSNDLNGAGVLTHTASSGIATPVLRRSPPTPETTPPKLDQQPRIVDETSNPRLPSTGPQSFETARENQISDEDASQPDSPSLRPSRQKWLRSAGHTKPKSIGLGLGLESEGGEQTPTEIAAHPSAESEELVSFGGAWDGATPEMEAVKGGADLAYRSELKRREPKRPQISDQLLETPLLIDESTPSPAMRTRSLRQGEPSNRRKLSHVPTDDGAGKRWTLQGDQYELGEKLREFDNRRLSQISATSTTVGAVILSTPPSRRKTLRHSSKFNDLNSASVESARSSHDVLNRDRQRRVEYVRTSKGRQQESMNSGLYGADDMVPSKKHDTVPVIVIPQRISSLPGCKFPFVQTLRRVKPLTITELQSSRPAVASEGPAGYFDSSQTERRTVSAYASLSPPKDEKQTVQQAGPVKAPLDSMSFANGTRNVSRADSNGSAGRDSISPPTRRQSQNGYRSTETSNARIASPDEGSNGEWSALRPRSSLITPFSLRSARSSTPGTLEVNEATAISIYPHTNKSILVVQHTSRRNSQPAEHSAIIASNAKFAIPAGSVQPPVIHEPRQLLDSPLQNPRSPPVPPDFKIIPPTPANLTEVSSPDRQQVPPSEQKPRRRLSNRVKQAFSNRRYSEAFVAPITRPFSLSRRSTVTGARRASTGIDPERNLHPSWRPRAFWDSRDAESDSDSDFGNDGFLVGNSLGMPTEGVKTFDPPRRRSSLSHRFGSLRLPGRRRAVSEFRQQQADSFYGDGTAPDPLTARRAVGNRGLSLRHRTTNFYRRSRHDDSSYEFIQPPHAQERTGSGGSNGVPRLGYQVQFVPFKGLAEKVKERREEARREKVREKLKGSIDVLRGV
ncbi:MAG: hypothetical protein Q9219_007005 [cf. Caloplaca sp. 3 TL-2023]